MLQHVKHINKINDARMKYERLLYILMNFSINFFFFKHVPFLTTDALFLAILQSHIDKLIIFRSTLAIYIKYKKLLSFMDIFIQQNTITFNR